MRRLSLCVRIHATLPRHADGALQLLGCALDKDAATRALSDWLAPEFEDQTAAAGLVVMAMRSFTLRQAFRLGEAVNELPLDLTEMIAEAPLQPLPAPNGAMSCFELGAVLRRRRCGPS